MRPCLDGERILVIEDDDNLRSDLVSCLESEGYQVMSCSAGLQAIELAHQHNFELIISDIRMAGMDGLETLERLQQRQPRVATLVITGFTAEADSIRAVRLGVGDYLKKPFRLDAFLQTVVRLLQGQRDRRKRFRQEQGLRSLADWALQGWLSQSDGEPVEQARLAERVALRLGLGREQCDLTRWSVLVEACQRLSGRQPEADLPPELLGCLAELRNDAVDFENLCLSARIALAVRGGDIPESPLAEALRAARTEPLAAPEPPDLRWRRRNQLRLGRSLEHAKEEQEAWRAYESLAAGDDRETVEALLGLMRLSVAKGHREQARTFAQQATTVARNINPLLHGLAALEAGLSMRLADYPRESSALLELARRLGKELGQPVLLAKSTLADPAAPEAAVGDALAVLLEEEHRYELVDAAGWIGPLVLQRQARQGHPLQGRLLQRLAREAPGLLRQFAQNPTPDRGERAALAQALAGSTHPDAREALRLLTVDGDSAVRVAAQQALQYQQDEPAPPVLRIHSLGCFEVFLGEHRLADSSFRSWKQRFLLSRLAASPTLLGVEKLMDEFWPDDGEGGRASLNVSYAHLRRTLRPPQWPKELDYVIRDKGRLGMNSELPMWHDLNEFFRLAEAVHADLTEQLRSLQQAASLYRGAFLENCYLEWAVTIRERAEARVLVVLRSLLQIFAHSQRHLEGLDYAFRLLELDPCCQEGHLAVMRAHLQAARPEAAVRQFELVRRTLQRELQMQPCIALLEAHQRALLNL